MAGPSPAVDAVAGNLTPDEWDVVRFDTPEDLIAGIENREAAGGLVFAADGVDIYTATAGGAPGAAAVNWLPDGWSTFGQLLPPGATGSLLRANAFFGGIGSGFPSVVLACWVALGIVLALIAARREPGGATTAVDPE
ncbi:hypothetical protein ACLQ3J_13750 [Rhodococcus sp. DT1]|uniref:hypothetical protein n=1 Tax=unclassified Rhodococcus (in: high G+C Gram-positive bacteria) TaxID=192944 RepID=UPI003CE6F2BF